VGIQALSAHPATPLNTGFTYDTTQAACAAGETFSVGLLTRIDDASGSTVYCYDRFGQLVRKVQTTNGRTFVLRYIFDVAGRMTSMVYPDGAVVDYVHDAQGRVTEVGATPAGGTRQIVLSNATYYPFGPVAEWSYGNGRVMKRSLNQNYQPDFVEVVGPGGLNLGYEFDEVGNLKKLRTANQAEPPLRAYAYDGLNRLTESRDGSSNALLEGYAYDKSGNRTSATVGAATTPYAYSTASHRLDSVGSTARSYDAAGNTLQIGGAAKSFVYDDRNRMRQYLESGIVKRNYDHNGRGEQVRTWLSANDDRYSVYDEGGQWLGEYDATGSTAAADRVAGKYSGRYARRQRGQPEIALHRSRCAGYPACGGRPDSRYAWYGGVALGSDWSSLRQCRAESGPGWRRHSVRVRYAVSGAAV
jgi:YD repeat-containing protein